MRTTSSKRTRTTFTFSSLFAAAVAGLIATTIPSCTLVLKDQCSTTADCTKKGAAYTGYVCNSDHYCDTGPSYCTAHAQCANPADPTNLNFFCDHAARECKKLAPAGCALMGDPAYLQTAVTNEDAVYMATWSQITGPNAAVFGLNIQNGYELANHDILQGGGITTPDGKARPLVAIACDEADPTKIVDQESYLIDTVHVLGLVGPILSGDANTMGPVAIGRKTPIMVNHANGVALASLDPNQSPHYFYRTSVSDALFVDAVAALVKNQLEPVLKGTNGSAAGGPLRVGLFHKDDPHGNGSAQAAVEKLVINGQPFADPSNLANTKNWSYPPSGDRHQRFVDILGELLPFAPHVLFFAGTSEMYDMYSLIESNWPAGKPKPRYIFQDIQPPKDLMPDQQARTFAVYPGPGPQYDLFASNLAAFTKTAQQPCCLTHEAPEAYDAFYLMALAIGGAGAGANGSSVAAILPQLHSNDPTARSLKIGAIGFSDGVQTILSKKPITVAGASGPLGFAPTGDPSGLTLIECYTPAGVLTASSLQFNSDTQTQSGDLSICRPLL